MFYATLYKQSPEGYVQEVFTKMVKNKNNLPIPSEFNDWTDWNFWWEFSITNPYKRS